MAIRVITAVSEHWFVGTLPRNEIRVQDVLNDGQTDFFRLSEVQVCPVGEPETCLAALSDVVVPKDHVQFVSLLDDRHEAPVKRRNNMVLRKPTDVFLILGRYFIQGELHVPRSNRESFCTMQVSGQKFFPVTQATIEISAVADQRSSPVVLANRTFVNAYQVGDGAAADRASGDVQSAPPSNEPENPEEDLLRMIRSVITDDDSGTVETPQSSR